MTSQYDDFDRITKKVLNGNHRNIIGGLWDEIGILQFNFLKIHGLLPNHYLLDIGCGSLRGGVKFIPYLDPNHYYGIDSNQSLLDAGYDIELNKLNLTFRIDKSNLQCSNDFNFNLLGKEFFDYAIAQSLFTHLSSEQIRLCLTNLQNFLPSGSKLFSTWFLVDNNINDFKQKSGVITHKFKDPYHYSLDDIYNIIDGLQWELIYYGEWNHPRSQKMIIFEKI